MAYLNFPSFIQFALNDFHLDSKKNKINKKKYKNHNTSISISGTSIHFSFQIFLCYISKYFFRFSF
jgi:hypothetical protein